MIDQPSGTLRRLHGRHLGDDVGDRRGVGFDSRRQRIASKRPEPHHARYRTLTGLKWKAIVVNDDEVA